MIRSNIRAANLCATRSRAVPRHGFTTSVASQRTGVNLLGQTKPKSKVIPKQKLAQMRYYNRNKYDTFKMMILSQFKSVLTHMGSYSETNREYRNLGIHSEHGLQREIELFRESIHKSIHMANKGETMRGQNPLFWTLRNAFIHGDVKGLTSELRYSFQSFLMRSRLTNSSPRQRKLADMRFPAEWFPATRALQRTIHLHVGPTNSGKTYSALQALENANSGIYGGPLRLLAHEIYTRFTAKGKPCAMITGEEQRIPDADNYFISCTVEMTPLNRLVDVAVLDEIQMIGDRERGWAWTQAFLGVMAKEVHLCGEERVVDLIKSICSTIGDKCIVHRYKRLSPLETMTESIGNNFKNLQKGDAIVAFTRVHLHGLKRAIENATGRRCAIVYGSLPPETRAQQAALFNEPDNDYDFLVASDAIGMGLNLEIKRVIFETTTKHDGMQFRVLSTSEIKQIGGRAGRYKTARQAAKGSSDSDAAAALEEPEKKMGYVTTIDKEDLPILEKAFRTDNPPLETAIICPPAFVIEQFADYFHPDTPLSFILQRLRELAPVSERFAVHVTEASLQIADAIQEFPLTIHESLTLLHSPVSLRTSGMRAVIQALAKCISKREGGALYDIEPINLELLDANLDDYQNQGKKYLKSVEALHHALTLYLWVSYRFPSIFVSQALAFHLKAITEEKIAHYLAHNTVFSADTSARLRQLQRSKAMKSELEAESIRQEREAQDLGGDDKNPAVDHHAPDDEGPGRWGEPGHEELLVGDESEYEELEDSPATDRKPEKKPAESSAQGQSS